MSAQSMATWTLRSMASRTPLAQRYHIQQGLRRTFATTSPCRAEPDQPHSSSLGTPSPKPSDSSQEGELKSNRALDGRASEHGGSVQKPMTPAGTAQGQDEEGDHPIHQDKGKSQEEKAKATEQVGQRPLDPADK